MNNSLQKSRSYTVGIALSGGAVRGLAHIGVIKALAEGGIYPTVIAGTSAGSIVGAALAAGMDWQSIRDMARSIFWPSLLDGKNLEKFCAHHLPETFHQLQLPFAAVATSVPSGQAIVMKRGHLASAISASCAMKLLRRAVPRDGLQLKDGGTACVLPSTVCRQMDADFVIASDVWELSSILRAIGVTATDDRGARFYPEQYRRAVAQADVLICPDIPMSGYIPGETALQKMIEAGERATHLAFSKLKEPTDRIGEIFRTANTQI